MSKRNPFRPNLPAMPQGLREQAASETAASERPDAPDATNGLTSGPEGYTGVVSDADKVAARQNIWTGLAYDVCRFAEDPQMSWDTIIAPLMKRADAEHEVLWARLEAVATEVAIRDATIASLRADRP